MMLFTSSKAQLKKMWFNERPEECCGARKPCEAVGNRVSFSYPLVYFVSLWDAGFQIVGRGADVQLSLAYVHLLKQGL